MLQTSLTPIGASRLRLPRDLYLDIANPALPGGIIDLPRRTHSPLKLLQSILGGLNAPRQFPDGSIQIVEGTQCAINLASLRGIPVKEPASLETIRSEPDSHFPDAIELGA
jgi:hypothetical protein